MIAIAATVSGSQPVSAGLDECCAPAREQEQRLSRGQAAVVITSVTLGVAVAGDGLAGSYVSIADLAERHHVPLADFVPMGVDGGLVAVVVLDLVLTWTGSPVGWLRQLVRVLSVGTIVANAVAGWPDPVAVGLRGRAGDAAGHVGSQPHCLVAADR